MNSAALNKLVVASFFNLAVDNPSKLFCAVCGERFRSAWQLMKHCHEAHDIKTYILPEETEKLQEIKKGTPSSRDRGRSLGKEEANGAELVDSVTEAECDICGQDFGNLFIRAHHRVNAHNLDNFQALNGKTISNPPKLDGCDGESA